MVETLIFHVASTDCKSRTVMGNRERAGWGSYRSPSGPELQPKRVDAYAASGLDTVAIVTSTRAAIGANASWTSLVDSCDRRVLSAMKDSTLC